MQPVMCSFGLVVSKWCSKKFSPVQLPFLKGKKNRPDQTFIAVTKYNENA